MNIYIIIEQRFVIDTSGYGWTPNAFARAAWDRHLEHFDTVTVIARAEQVQTAPAGYVRADGDRVRLAPVPFYLGPTDFARKIVGVRASVHAAVRDADAVILRAPGMLSALGYDVLRRADRPYGIHVVGDPYDVFAPGAVRHRARPFFRWWFSRQLRRQCKDSAVATYVTEAALQRRYPPGASTWSTHFSDVELGTEAYVDQSPPPRESSPFEIVTVGSLDQPYKGVDVLIEAVRQLREDGPDVRLRVVGGGRLRASLEDQVAEAGLADRVLFVGNVAGAAAVRAEMARANLMVVASRTEGLPRVLLEAMALGLPCVGTSVGGIPELLPADARVPPDDAGALADRIRQVLRDPGRRAEMGRRNLQVAKTHASALTAQRQGEALNALRDVTAQWLRCR